MVSSVEGSAPIRIHQDVNLYSLELEAGKEIDFQVKSDRQAYLVQIEGTSNINGIKMMEWDGMESVEEDLLIKAQTTSHYLVVEMKKEA